MSKNRYKQNPKLMTDQGSLIQNMLAQYGMNDLSDSNISSSVHTKRVKFAFSNDNNNNWDSSNQSKTITRSEIVQSLLETAKNQSNNGKLRRATRNRFNLSRVNNTNRDAGTSSTGYSSIATVVTSDMLFDNEMIDEKQENIANPENSFFNQAPAKISSVFTAPQKSILSNLRKTNTASTNSNSGSSTKLDLGFNFTSFLSNKRRKMNQNLHDASKKQKIENPSKSSEIKKKLSKEQELVASTIAKKKTVVNKKNQQKTKVQPTKNKVDDNNLIKTHDDNEFDFIDQIFSSDETQASKKRKAEKISNTQSEKMKDDNEIKAVVEKKPSKKTTTTSSTRGRKRTTTSTSTKRRTSRQRSTSASKKK
jgi:hypothetical protein